MSYHNLDNLRETDSDSFWEPGNYKRTTKRIEDNYKVCCDLQQLIQERADIEKSYAKTLRGWSKKWSELIEKGPAYGTTEIAWKGILTESERVSDIHMKIKENLCVDVISKIKLWQKDNYHFTLMQNKERKDMEDLFKKSQKPWIKLLTKVEKAKTEYHAVCKIEKNASNQEFNAVGDSSLSLDQINKIHERADKARNHVQKCQERYEQAIIAISKYKPVYVEDMVSVFRKCQKMEKEHLQFFKKALFSVHACLDLRQFSNIPLIYEELYHTINHADYQSDLIWWSNNYGVNMKLKTPLFIEYIEDIRDVNKSRESKQALCVVAASTTFTNHQSSNENIQSNNTDIDALSTSTIANNINNGTNQKNGDIKTPSSTTEVTIYEGAGQWNDNDILIDNGEPGILVKALYDYRGIENNELSFKKVNRLDKEYSGRHCLLLPDATQLPPKFDQLFFNLQAPSNISADTYAIEIKPKQGWLLSDKFYDLMNKKSKTSTGFTMRNKYCHYYTNIPNHGRLQQQQQHYYQMDQSSSSESLKITKCRYCSKQFLKLKQQKIRQLSNYCPLKLFSGSPDKMLEALSALFKCPQNNLRIYRNGQLLYDDHLSKYVNIEAIFTIDQVQVIKYLLIICLLRDYTEENKTGPKANDDNSLKTTPTTTNIATCTAATVGKAKAADLDAAIVSAIASELLNPQTSVGFADLDIKQLQQQQKQQKCEWEQQKAVYKEVLKVREDTPSIMRAAMTSSMPLSATTCLNIQSMHNGTTEMLHLPINCILQKILQLQLLVKKNFFYMFEREYHHKYEKSYNHLQKLLEKFHMNQDILNFSQLNNENEYLLGATALDCSIMITFREVMTSIENLSFPTSLRPYLIEVPELNRRFISKVTLLDLDAKPDNHFAKYCQQTENILKLLQ